MTNSMFVGIKTAFVHVVSMTDRLRADCARRRSPRFESHRSVESGRRAGGCVLKPGRDTAYGTCLWMSRMHVR
jgi:hypothetical protein